MNFATFAGRLGRDAEIRDVNGQPIAVYAIATLKSGEKIREVMGREAILAVRDVAARLALGLETPTVDETDSTEDAQEGNDE